MKKGSITVFLSLVLVLLFSFLLTTLEAARLRGATAYLSMVTELAGDSFLAAYYYPLFQNYRLFGVDAGRQEDHSVEDFIKENLEENLVFGMEGLEGGVLQFQETSAEILEYTTLLSNGETEFLTQIRQQAVLDGVSLALEELFSEELFTEAGVVGEIYREQEEALAVTATVTEELVKLMELADGIRMKNGGIAFDKNGKMQGKDTFIKQLMPMEQSEIKSAYENTEVFRTISAGFFRADIAAQNVQTLIADADALEKKITKSENRIAGYEEKLEKVKEILEAGQEEQESTYLAELEARIEELEDSIEKEEEKIEAYQEDRKNKLSQIKKQYNTIQKKLQAVEGLLEDALDIADRLEKKQKVAGIAVGAYETFLEGMKASVSEELYRVFEKELEKMKLYAGLDEKGFSVEVIRGSLENNQELLKELSLSGFSEKRLEEADEEMEEIKTRMKEYTAEGLWFTYGDIVVAEQTWETVTGALGELLTTGILSLVGIAKEDVSDREIDGTELPSACLEKENILEELMTCMEEVQALFQSGGIGEVLESAGNTLLDGTALELYSRNYFHSYGEEVSYTKLAYEREYLIFGAEKDKSNLLSVVLHLVAIRTLLCMVMLLKSPEKMDRLEMLSAGIAGLTGIPVLAAAVKYSMLLLWSVEEALIEVAALLQGKRIAVVGTGEVEFEELFSMNKATITQKATDFPEGIGADYRDYLTLLSLTRGTTERAYRAMDLIQENIRYRYNDSFRIRNVVTKVAFCAKTELQQLFDTGVFPVSVYRMESKEEPAYE